MNLKDIDSLEDLKSIGTVDDIVTALQKEVTPLKIEANSYDNILEIINILKEKWLPFSKGPFISKQAEYIYYLTKLEGKQRNNALGIKDEHYENHETAKAWRRRIESFVHPDKGGDQHAFNVLRKIYNVMVDTGGDFDE